MWPSLTAMIHESHAHDQLPVTMDFGPMKTNLRTREECSRVYDFVSMTQSCHCPPSRCSDDVNVTNLLQTVCDVVTDPCDVEVTLGWNAQIGLSESLSESSLNRLVGIVERCSRCVERSKHRSLDRDVLSSFGGTRSDARAYETTSTSSFLLLLVRHLLLVAMHLLLVAFLLELSEVRTMYILCDHHLGRQLGIHLVRRVNPSGFLALFEPSEVSDFAVERTSFLFFEGGGTSTFTPWITVAKKRDLP